MDPTTAIAARARRTRPWHVITRSRASTLIGLGVLVLAVLIAILAPWISPYSPNEQNLDAILLPIGPEHLLGTDDLGRDVMSRMLVGTQVSLLASLLAVGVALAIGLPVGLLAGYFGGIVDNVLTRIVDTLMAFPAIILAIGIVAVMGPSIVNTMLAVGIVLSPSVARLARAQTMAVKEETYIEAARSFGARGLRRLILPHIVPNMIQPILVQTGILMGHALLAEASLSFLGLGVQPPDPSWGTVLARAYTFHDQAPFQIFIPGIAIAATVFAVNVSGDAIQEWLDPRRRKR